MTASSTPGKSARLRVELRVLGVVGLAWTFSLIHAGAWAFATVGLGGDLASMPFLSLLAPQIVGALAVGFSLFNDFPRVRWPRADVTRPGPSATPMLVAGFPLTLLAPLFILRDRATGRDPPPDPTQIEPAFQQLLQLPRSLGIKFLIWGGLAGLADAVLLGAHANWPRDSIIAATILWLAAAGPLTAIVIGWTRAIIRPVYLSAPRDQVQFRRTGDLRLRLTVNATIAVVGVIVAPLCVGYLWITSHRATDPRTATVQVAERLLELAGTDGRAEMGRLLGENPRTTVWVGDRAFGALGSEPPPGSGLIDEDADGLADVVVMRSDRALVRAPLPPPRDPVPPPLIVGAIAALLSSIGAIVLLARDVGRDVTRAAAQADAVASGTAPAPLTEGSFSTFELRELVGSVDRLVKRITEANVNKYVAIEKAKEADRLKSQFLANMSHDLRSPLISILGFSELLLTGIDGELEPEQRSMVEPIHASGRELLQQIDDILDTAKIEASRLDLHPEPTPPATLVNRAIHSAKKRQVPDIDYEVDIAPGLPPAFVDPYRTVQAIENVLLFASERLEAGAISVRVRQGKTDRGRVIAIGVETPVRPATADQLALARRGFFRIPGHRGLGLGLPIAGSILELEGGSLSIEDLGEGMIFTLHLVSPEARRGLRLRTVREIA